MAYRITNKALGTTITVDTLPDGVRVGVTDLGPSWNNRPPPKLIVEEVASKARWIVENHLTDNVIGVVQGDTAREAIDAAYQAKGWLSFTDAREKRATAAEEHEIKARRIDADGNEYGPYVSYSEAV
jgi:hypothetical protein